MEPLLGYCVKCRREREMVDVQRVELPVRKGVQAALKAVCAVCGTGIFKILAPKKAES